VRVILDSEKCQGHGRCYVLAPEVFAPDEEGYGMVLDADVPAELLEQATRGAQGCPEAAITIEDREGTS
jgi:ferredoxin